MATSMSGFKRKSWACRRNMRTFFRLRTGKTQWEFQDPKMEVLYHIRPYFVGIFPYIALTLALYMVGTSNLGSWNGHWCLAGCSSNQFWYTVEIFLWRYKHTQRGYIYIYINLWRYIWYMEPLPWLHPFATSTAPQVQCEAPKTAKFVSD